MKKTLINISETFSEVAIKTIDERKRVQIGNIFEKMFGSIHRVKIMLGEDGDILLIPLVEIPVNELLQSSITKGKKNK